jgi:hypothetical protein
MATDVVVPFPRSRSKRGLKNNAPASDWVVPSSERGRLWSRLSTAREVVRGVVETLSYLREARVSPPPLLPPARSDRWNPPRSR